jgi:Tfp pilus assembly protein PilF
MLAHSSVPRALELLDLALAEDSASPLAHMLRAEAYLLRGDHESAARSFAKAEPKTTSEGRRYSRLKDRIGEMAGV